MERATISDMIPRIIHISNDEQKTITTTITALTDLNNARIVYSNTTPRAVTLLDDDEASDQIRTNPINLEEGDTADISHTIRFQLKNEFLIGGANITVEVHIENDNKERISKKVRELLVFITAK